MCSPHERLGSTALLAAALPHRVLTSMASASSLTIVLRLASRRHDASRRTPSDPEATAGMLELRHDAQFKEPPAPDAGVSFGVVLEDKEWGHPEARPLTAVAQLAEARPLSRAARLQWIGS